MDALMERGDRMNQLIERLLVFAEERKQASNRTARELRSKSLAPMEMHAAGSTQQQVLVALRRYRETEAKVMADQSAELSVHVCEVLTHLRDEGVSASYEYRCVPPQSHVGHAFKRKPSALSRVSRACTCALMRCSRVQMAQR